MPTAAGCAPSRAPMRWSTSRASRSRGAVDGGAQAGHPREPRGRHPRRGRGPANHRRAWGVPLSGSAIGYYGTHDGDARRVVAGRDRFPGHRLPRLGARSRRAAEATRAAWCCCARGSSSRGAAARSTAGAALSGGAWADRWVRAGSSCRGFTARLDGHGAGRSREAASGPVNLTAPAPVANARSRGPSGASCAAPRFCGARVRVAPRARRNGRRDDAGRSARPAAWRGAAGSSFDTRPSTTRCARFTRAQGSRLRAGRS